MLGPPRVAWPPVPALGQTSVFGAWVKLPRTARMGLEGLPEPLGQCGRGSMPGGSSSPCSSDSQGKPKLLRLSGTKNTWPAGVFGHFLPLEEGTVCRIGMGGRGSRSGHCPLFHTAKRGICLLLGCPPMAKLPGSSWAGSRAEVPLLRMAEGHPLGRCSPILQAPVAVPHIQLQL